MSEDNNGPIIAGHDYDGIQELDNPLPGWWLATFFATIIFGFLYYIHYTFTDAPDLKKELEISMAELAQVSSSAAKQNTTISAADLDARVKDPNLVAKGKGIFIGKCASCHAESGGGMVGPNLTDKFWIHGKGDAESIHQVIQKGVLEKGMPAWENMLGAEDVIAATAYVVSLKGKNVPGGKAAQGTEYP